MSKIVLFEIGEGDFQRGFAVIIRVCEDRNSYSAVITSETFPTFPPAPEIQEIYQNWQSTYCKLGHIQRITIPKVQITNFSSREDCNQAAKVLEMSLNNWLNQPSVRQLERQLLQKIGESEQVNFILQTQDPLIRRLPWHLWDFFQTCYPQAEIILSADYKPSSQNFQNQVKILALFGNSENINIQKDLETLTKLPNAKIDILQEPSKKELTNKLRSQAWDILFFAGHSCSQEGDKSGEIHINQKESLSLQNLQNTLRYAVKKGLKLAFFNSCDGLGLAKKLADLKIPYIVVMREPVPDTVAQHFLEYFLNAFANGESFYLSIHQARERLQEELEDEYPCASWLPVVFQNPAVPELSWPKYNQLRRRLILGLGIACFSLTFLIGNFQREINYLNRTSYGEQILVKPVTTLDKEKGVHEFWWRNYEKAAQYFQNSLNQQPNDPETLIYKNNALIGHKSYSVIVVTVPISINLNIAQEMLRGVAQAQDEINSQGGINGKFLKIKIADDQNDTNIAEKLAHKFVENPEILAVVGHNASNASLAAAPIYEQGKLVMITPTSFSIKLLETGKYIFRTVPEVFYFADALAEYIVIHQGYTKLSVCVDSQAEDNLSFSSQMEGRIINRYRGQIINISCDFSSDNFDPKQIINDALDKRVNGLILAPHVDRINRALEVAKVNKGRLKLFGSATLYTFQTLEVGKEAVNGLTVAIPWHPSAFPGNTFPENARKMWGGNVTWRTAFSYDAMKALIAGLRNSKQPQSREELRQALKRDDFLTYGATNVIRFRPSGDRKINDIPMVLVQVKPSKNSLTGYDFFVIDHTK